MEYIKQLIQLSENVVDNIFSPLLVVVITWFLARMREPDYGKKDWKCKEDRGSFARYCIHIVVAFTLPILVWALVITLWQIDLKRYVSRINNIQFAAVIYGLYVTVVHCVIYGFYAWIIHMLDFYFWPKKLHRKWEVCIKLLLYMPIVYNMIMGIVLCVPDDTPAVSWFHSFLLLAFQLWAMGYLDDGKLYKYNKITITMKEGEQIEADVRAVYKKGKWLRIGKTFEMKEILLLYDDVKRIEYHN